MSSVESGNGEALVIENDETCLGSFISTCQEAPILRLVSNDGSMAKVQWKEHEEENETRGTPNSSIERYEITWQHSDETPKSAKTLCTEYTITNLIPGATYCAYVVQMTDERNSELSNTLVFDAAPKKPTDINVKPHEASPSDSLVVTFKDENSMPMRYEISVQPLTSEEPIEQKSERRTVLIQGLVPGESYSVQIIATGGKLKSRAACYENIANTCPEMPKGVVLQQNEGGIELTWDKLAIKPSFYKVQCRENNAVKTYETKHTMFCLDDIKFATTYRFRVAAVNKAGNSEFSEEKTATTAPAPPTNVRVCTNPCSPKTSFIVNFEDQNPAETTYHVVALSMEGKEMRRVDANTKSTVLDKLKPGRSYSVYVIANYVGLDSKRSFFVQ